MSRSGIGDVNVAGLPYRQQSFSKRANKGKLDVISKRCDKCGHSKALQTLNQTKCARCKQ